MQHAEQPTIKPVVYNISQVAKVLDLSRAKVYQLIYHEGLPVIRFGRAMRVLPESLQEWLKRREEVS
jgi:excisionase family DNA binding protein